MAHLIKTLIFLILLCTPAFAQQQLLTTESAAAGYTLLQSFENYGSAISVGKDTTEDTYCVLTTFQSDFEDTVDYISIWVTKTGNPTQDYTISICDSSGGSTPTPSNCISTSTINGADMVDDEWTDITAFSSGFSVSDTTEYIIQVSASAISATDYIGWCLDSESEYTRSNPGSGCGGSWSTASSSFTGAFKLYK